jgi:hypothetical protein
MVAERLKRRWLGFELDRDYAALSILRFADKLDSEEIGHLYELAQTKPVDLTNI